MTYNQNPFGGYPFVDDSPKADPDAVPGGSTKEILAWVDGDQRRAQLALDAELAREKPRKTLVDPLESLISDED